MGIGGTLMKNESRKLRKLLVVFLAAILLTVALPLTDLTQLSSAKGKDEITLEDYDLEITSVAFTDHRYYAFTGQKTPVYITISNVNETDVPNVMAEVYEVNDIGEEIFLKTLHYGKIKAGEEKEKHIHWTPTLPGRNWIKVVAGVKEEHGPEMIPLIERTVSCNVLSSSKETMYIDNDWIIDEPEIFENLNIIVDGDVYVYAPSGLKDCSIIAGDLIVEAPFEIDTASNWDMAATFDGEFTVQVNAPEGHLIVQGKIWNNPSDYHYDFVVYNELTVDGQYGGGIIENVNGISTDPSVPGGIQCINTDNVVFKNGAVVRNSNSHGIYLDNSDAVIEDTLIYGNAGVGLVSNDSAPYVGASLLLDNYYGGIHVRNYSEISPFVRPEFTPGDKRGYYIWREDDTY